MKIMLMRKKAKDMLTLAVANRLVQQPEKWEDHDAVAEIQDHFGTDKSTAEYFLARAMSNDIRVRKRIIVTDTTNEEIRKAKCTCSLKCDDYPAKLPRGTMRTRRIKQCIKIGLAAAVVIGLCTIVIMRVRGQEVLEAAHINQAVNNNTNFNTLSGPSGYYLMQPTIGNLDGTAVVWPELYMKGVVIRIGANQIVTTNDPHKYNWKLLDDRLRELKRRSPNAHWQLQVTTGIYYPKAWELAGAKTVAFNHKKYGTNNRQLGRIKALLPWDVKALQLYADLMMEVGKRYGADPTLDMVHVTHPQFYSPEMHMPSEVARLPDFTKKIKPAYEAGIGIVTAAFPNKAVCLNLFNVSKYATGDRSIKLTREIATEAVNRHPNLWVQVNSWNAKNTWASYDAYKLMVALDAHKQIEQVQPSRDPKYGGSFEQSLHYIPDSGARSACIYNSDQPKAKRFPQGALAIPDAEVEPKYDD